MYTIKSQLNSKVLSVLLVHLPTHHFIIKLITIIQIITVWLLSITALLVKLRFCYNKAKEWLSEEKLWQWCHMCPAFLDILMQHEYTQSLQRIVGMQNSTLTDCAGKDCDWTFYPIFLAHATLNMFIKTHRKDLKYPNLSHTMLVVQEWISPKCTTFSLPISWVRFARYCGKYTAAIVFGMVTCIVKSSGNLITHFSLGNTATDNWLYNLLSPICTQLIL